ncbi:MAG: methionyl aminopeptidase [Parcubacteria group bacterium Greene0416_79]|nr:MAG: methionyl aminopeptidase [Parcubacteria group bacterium Greene0416_79]
MAVTIKSKKEIAILREGGKKLAVIRDELAARAKAGVSAQELEDLSAKLFEEAGGEASFLHYRGKKSEKPFPAAFCISVNDAIVHGLPHREVVFKEGDLVGIDVGLRYRGLFTDTAVTVPVGAVSKAGQKLLEVTKEALAVGIAAVRAGVTTGDIGCAIEHYVASAGSFGIVRTLAGHGVGYAVHEEPHIPNFGKRGEGVTLPAGAVIAIEPMLTLGGEKLVLDQDGFTFRTADGSLSAHFEHTLAVTRHGCEVLTEVKA